MGHSKKGWREAEAKRNANVVDPLRLNEIGNVAGARIVGHGRRLTPEMQELLDARHELTSALRGLRPKCCLTHPKKKDYFLRPAYVEENIEQLQVAEARKRPKKSPKKISKKRWEELGGGVGIPKGDD